MEFKIESEIPVPSVGTRVAHDFPWQTMSVGDSFLIPPEYWAEKGMTAYDPEKAPSFIERVKNNFRTWRSHHPGNDGKMVTLRKHDGGLRCWMISAPAGTKEPASTAPAKADATSAKKKK